MKRLLPPADSAVHHLRVSRATGLYLAALLLSLALRAVPLLHWVRLAVDAAALYQLVRARGRMNPVARFVALPIWALIAAGVADDGRSPIGPLIVAALGAPFTRYLAPWIGTLRARLLGAIVLIAAGGLAVRALFPSTLDYPGRESWHGRVDCALFGLLLTVLVVIATGASRELTQRWIRRARIRTKLVVSFGIFAIAPAAFVAAFLAVSAWVRAGQSTSGGVGAYIASTSIAEQWIASVKQRHATMPDPAAIEADTRTAASLLEARHAGVTVVRRSDDGAWTTHTVLPAGVTVPAIAPVSDSARVARVVSGLTAMSGRFYWAGSTLWTRGADSLVVLALEPVTQEQLQAYGALRRADVYMVTATRRDPVVTINLDEPDPVAITAQSDSLKRRLEGRTTEDRRAIVDSLEHEAGVAKLGVGRYSKSLSFPAGGATLPCFAWDDRRHRWTSPGVVVFARSGFMDAILPRAFSGDPVGNVFAWVLLTLGAFFLVADLIAVAWGARIARFITRGTASLRSATAAIGEGDFSARVMIASEDEFGELAQSFNAMAVGLEQGREAMLERAQLRRELDLARQIQTRLLPGEPPRLPRLEIAATNAMSQQVGGDYYDFVQLADGRLGLCVADVSGHGVAAALLMSNVKAALVSSAAIESTPEGITARVNRLICGSIEPGRFVTFFFAALDPRTLHVEYVNAGHPAPMLVRAGGVVERLTEGGVLLGVMPDAAFTRGAVTLADGDLLTLFTDGLDEALDANNMLYGQDRVEATLCGVRGQHAADVVERLLSDVRAHEGARGASDDLTLMVLRVAEPG